METSYPIRIIVVEGKTDLHVILHLLEKSNPNMRCERVNNYTSVARLPGKRNLQINICQEGSFSELCDEIEVWLMKPKLECVGFVFDANGDPRRNWQRVRNRILRVYEELQDIPSPELREIFCETPVPGGIWVRDCVPKVGMWMMPNNKDTGAIEEFLAYMIRQEDHCWEHTQKYVKTIFQEGIRFPKRKVLKEKNIPKANIHAWLAVQEEPGKPPGTAIKTGYFDTENLRVQAFRQWLGNLP